MADSLHLASAAGAVSAELQYYLHQKVRTPQHRSTIWGIPCRFGKMFYTGISLFNSIRKNGTAFSENSHSH